MDFETELYKAKQLIFWLVDGIGTHNIDSSLWSSITAEYVIENYNVEPSYFIK